jgi:hypothetical protein
MRYFAQPLRHSSWRKQILISILLLTACAASAWHASAVSSGSLPLIAVVALLDLAWCMHLCKAGCPEPVAVLASLLMSWELSRLVVPQSNGTLLAGGVFVYLVIWIFCAYEREPGLQPLATLAVLISAGILATPTIAIACAVLGIGFFVRNRRAGIGGSLGFALLLFTPLMLCLVALSILAFLRAEALFARPLAETLRMISNVGVRRVAAQSGINLLNMAKGLLFQLVVTAVRIGTRREGAPDVALVLVVLVVAVLHATRWMATDAVSIPIVSLTGAAALLTQSFLPPSRAILGRTNNKESQ